MNEWVIELTNTVWLDWKAVGPAWVGKELDPENYRGEMKPTTLEECCKWMLHFRPPEVSIDWMTYLRIRNVQTNEVIPYEVFA